MTTQPPSSEPNGDAASRLSPRALLTMRIGLVATVAAALALAYRLGVFAELGEPQRLAASLVAMGAWGYLVFVVAYAVLQPFGVPGTVFVVAAPLIWPWETAFTLSMTGTMSASVVGFSFSRFLARDFVAARIPERFRKYDEALANHALRTVFLLRLVFWMPQALHAFFGVSNVRFSTHFWGSLLGYAAPLFLVSYLGDEMFDASGRIEPGAYPVFGGLLAFSIGVALLARWFERRASAT